MKTFLSENLQKAAFLLLLGCQSCQYLNINNSKYSKESLLKEELQSINWKQVDEYPMIADCETLSDDAQQNQCFFEYLSADIKNRIKKNFNIKLLLKDTVFVKVTVRPDAQVLFQTQISANNLKLDHRKIDSILLQGTIDFPKIKPALKRGILVQSEFILPIVF